MGWNYLSMQPFLVSVMAQLIVFTHDCPLMCWTIKSYLLIKLHLISINIHIISYSVQFVLCKIWKRQRLGLDGMTFCKISGSFSINVYRFPLLLHRWPFFLIQLYVLKFDFHPAYGTLHIKPKCCSSMLYHYTKTYRECVGGRVLKLFWWELFTKDLLIAWLYTLYN